MTMIEVLFFAGCPNHEPTLRLVREVVRELGVEIEIREVEVRDDADAQRLSFVGSPSVRVNGTDIDPDGGAQSNFALGCRMYGTSGIPPKGLLVKALREVT